MALPIRTGTTGVDRMRSAPASARWSTDLPAGRVVCVNHPIADIASVLDPQAQVAPAVLVCHIGGTDSAAVVVAGILDELEAAALGLFPSWLPGGADIDGRTLLDVAEVRALAKRLAATSRHFGPFVADLAEAAVRGTRLDPARYARETRAAGLARVLATGYRRSHTVLVVTAPPDLPVHDQHALAAACEWLAAQGRLGLAVDTSAIPAIDRFTTVTASPPAGTGTDAHGEWSSHSPEPVRLRYPALAGRPHPGSAAEKKLDAALQHCEWARGGRWNTIYQPDPLRAPICVDLTWPDARCVVEVDGDDHRMPAKYAADRQRDVRLQLDGYAVLRFTNEQVLGDVSAVVTAIEQCVRGRRRETGSTRSATEGGTR